MRHHLGDFLDRQGGYWTIVPNRERYAYAIGDVPAGSPEITIVTIGKDEENWRRVLTLPNLEELTLHEPTREQLEAVGSLDRVTRLRITHARPRTLDFIRSMTAVEELVLEYVSGFEDLSPLRSLKRLRSLHLENLRRVFHFDGLSGLDGLRYLSIGGTLDWKQPIADFEFLRGLPSLEVLRLFSVINKTPYPALLPALSLKRLERIRIVWDILAAEEYALLEEGLEGVEGSDYGPYRRWAYASMEVPRDDVRSRLPEDVLEARHPEVTIIHGGVRVIPDPATEWFMFTGKGASRVKCTSAHAAERCRAYAEKYAEMRARAREVIRAQDER